MFTSACRCCHTGSCRQQTDGWLSMASEIKAASQGSFLCLVFASKSGSNLHSDLSGFCKPSLHSLALIDDTFCYLFPRDSNVFPLHRHISSVSVVSRHYQELHRNLMMIDLMIIFKQHFFLLALNHQSSLLYFYLHCWLEERKKLYVMLLIDWDNSY